MRRLRHGAVALGLVAALGVLGVAPVAAELPPHGHMLIHGIEFGPGGITYRKCVDLANNRAITLHAHHRALHIGPGGEALREHAGHLVVPTAPVSPWEDCAALAEEFGPPTK